MYNDALALVPSFMIARVRASEKRSRFYHIGQLAHQRNSGKTAWESEEARKSKALALCETSGLDKHQRKLCAKFPLEILAAFQGYRDAVNECQYQFRYERWNCSSLVNVGTNVQPLSIPMMRRGKRKIALNVSTFQQPSFIALREGEKEKHLQLALANSDKT